jgi:hypothetical protein
LVIPRFTKQAIIASITIQPICACAAKQLVVA